MGLQKRWALAPKASNCSDERGNMGQRISNDLSILEHHGLFSDTDNIREGKGGLAELIKLARDQCS